MGSGSSKGGGGAPKPPNPYVVADAQGQLNLNSALTQQKMNAIDQLGPFGATLYQDIGGGRYAQNTFLSPGQQALLSGSEGVGAGANRQAQGILGNLGTGMYEGQAYDALTSRLLPDLDRREDQTRSRLAAQGITAGSDAYNNAIDEVGRARNDALVQAALGGLSARGQFVNEAQQMAALGRPFGIPNAQLPGGTGVSPADITSAFNNAYAGQLSAYNQQQQNQSGKLGNLVGAAGTIGSAAIGVPKPF